MDIIIAYLLQSTFGALIFTFIFYFFIKNKKWYIQYGLTFIFGAIMTVLFTIIVLSFNDQTNIDVISLKYILVRDLEYIFILICIQIIHKLIKFLTSFNKS